MSGRWFPVFACVFVLTLGFLLTGCNTPDEGQPIKKPAASAPGSGPTPTPAAAPGPAPQGSATPAAPGSATSGSTATQPPTTPVPGPAQTPPQPGGQAAPGTPPATPMPGVAPTPAPSAAPPPTVPPGMEAVKAQAGVTKQGSSLAGVQGPIVTEAKAFFAARDKLVFTAQIPQALNIYKATHDNKGPKTHEEFMQEIIQANQIQLPSLNEGSSYRYDPEKEEVLVIRPRQ